VQGCDLEGFVASLRLAEDLARPSGVGDQAHGIEIILNRNPKSPINRYSHNDDKSTDPIMPKEAFFKVVSLPQEMMPQLDRPPAYGKRFGKGPAKAQGSIIFIMPADGS
jgi:hypothetical protein